MPIFRAYLQDAAGAVTWAAWIEASSPSQAASLAGPLCAGATPSVELWWAAPRKTPDASALDAV